MGFARYLLVAAWLLTGKLGPSRSCLAAAAKTTDLATATYNRNKSDFVNDARCSVKIVAKDHHLHHTNCIPLLAPELTTDPHQAVAKVCLDYQQFHKDSHHLEERDNQALLTLHMQAKDGLAFAETQFWAGFDHPRDEEDNANLSNHLGLAPKRLELVHPMAMPTTDNSGIVPLECREGTSMDDYDDDDHHRDHQETQFPIYLLLQTSIGMLLNNDDDNVDQVELDGKAHPTRIQGVDGMRAGGSGKDWDEQPFVLKALVHCACSIASGATTTTDDEHLTISDQVQQGPILGLSSREEGKASYQDEPGSTPTSTKEKAHQDVSVSKHGKDNVVTRFLRFLVRAVKDAKTKDKALQDLSHLEAETDGSASRSSTSTATTSHDRSLALAEHGKNVDYGALAGNIDGVSYLSYEYPNATSGNEDSSTVYHEPYTDVPTEAPSSPPPGFQVNTSGYDSIAAGTDGIDSQLSDEPGYNWNGSSFSNAVNDGYINDQYINDQSSASMNEGLIDQIVNGFPQLDSPYTDYNSTVSGLENTQYEESPTAAPTTIPDPFLPPWEQQGYIDSGYGSSGFDPLTGQFQGEPRPGDSEIGFLPPFPSLLGDNLTGSIVAGSTLADSTLADSVMANLPPFPPILGDNLTDAILADPTSTDSAIGYLPSFPFPSLLGDNLTDTTLSNSGYEPSPPQPWNDASISSASMNEGLINQIGNGEAYYAPGDMHFANYGQDNGTEYVEPQTLSPTSAPSPLNSGLFSSDTNMCLVSEDGEEKKGGTLCYDLLTNDDGMLKAGNVCIKLLGKTAVVTVTANTQWNLFMNELWVGFDGIKEVPLKDDGSLDYANFPLFNGDYKGEKEAEWIVDFSLQCPEGENTVLQATMVCHSLIEKLDDYGKPDPLQSTTAYGFEHLAPDGKGGLFGWFDFWFECECNLLAHGAGGTTGSEGLRYLRGGFDGYLSSITDPKS